MTVLLYPPILGWSYLGLESGEINQVGVFHPVLTILADRVYGAQAIWEYILECGASYVIPPQKNISHP